MTIDAYTTSLSKAAKIRTEFQAPLYVDATLAGLSPLIPIPVLDWWLEERFRRRMVDQIAGYNNRTLKPEVRQALTVGGRSLLKAAVLFALKLPLRLILKLMRKVVYVLAVKEATEKLSYYWQRAFLLDYMLRAGHLENQESAVQAQQAMQQTLRVMPSPLGALAGQLAQRVRHALSFGRSSSESLRGAADEQRSFVARQWEAYEGFLIQLAERYDQAYHRATSAP